jgi:16S rRNA (guanine527-N7)-methyltransferase
MESRPPLSRRFDISRPPSTIASHMNTTRIAELLQPFLGPDDGQRLTANDLLNISTYIDILTRWNAHINLTAIREPEEIVTRHFGESLFAARHLFPRRSSAESLIDIGSGAGFPGLPIKIWALDLQVTLIESNHKKATFLRETARTLTLTNINVFPGRAEDYPTTPANVVTLRAVEHFEKTIPIATRLVAPGGRLALLISQAQLPRAHKLTPGFVWQAPLPIPMSSSRILAIGVREP